ncbi:probable disease resistance protein At5g63020 [Olea europaea var. sylvestris]|uniref:probable disease resistance protein At5g63020 n=1 Tax=Olea europaea var. sylvestris TaxID=158386 RepID=UPI000C1D55A6|nr:probable disease resistance protein At5g63020 [Olea europaea var. sylvestris]
MGDMLANALVNVVNLVSDYYYLDKKMQNLKRKVEQLSCHKADMVARLREEEHHPGKRRKNVVKYWLSEVVSKQKEFESLEVEVNQKSCISRVKLAKRANAMIEEVTELLDQGIFFEGVVLDVSETIEEKFVTVEWRGQAFNENLKTVKNYLLGNEVSSIGVYGMGGVGKTTLAQCIYNELKNESSFCGNIFWFTVSQDLNIHKLQDDFRKALKLDPFDEDDEHKRAAKLGGALERKKRFVLMLDDVWTHFLLERIGISPTLHGFKIIVISRSLEVCRKMKCQKCVKVEVLSDEEDWKLFMNKLSDGKRLPPKVEEIAREVVKKCASLPLAIITMAGSLREVVDIHDWRDALEELIESCVGRDVMEDEVFPILLCSFNRLRDPILKRCFLYCSLYPEDRRIERHVLISSFISEGLMDTRRSRQAYFDQGHKILNKLESVCLLERCEESNYVKQGVKMHDLIRDMALKITKDDYMVKAGLQLKEIPEEQEWKEDLVKVSLMENMIKEISRVTSPKCPKLSTLLLMSNPLKFIPDSFFLQMRGLHVLNLSHTPIEYLPSSISDLKELNALLLNFCVLLTFLPPLGNLKELKELGLRLTSIKEIPEGMKSLTNLKCLDTVDSYIATIPTGTLQRLSLLQHLMLPFRTTIPIEEVAGLKQLEDIHCKFGSVNDFNIFMKSLPSDGQLNIFDIRIGDTPVYHTKDLVVKQIIFGTDSLKKGERGRDEITLPRNIERVEFVRCGLDSCLFDNIQQVNNAIELKHCIVKGDGIEFIVRLSLEKELMPLHYLQNLILEHLPNFIGLIRWDVTPTVAPLPHGLFSRLQSLRIWGCDKIKKLLPPSLVLNLHNLKRLIVSSCAKMEEIIGEDESDAGFGAESNTDITLPRLEFLQLSNLPELKSICKGTIICHSIEVICLYDITKVRKVPLFLQLNNDGQLSPPPSLKMIKVFENDKGWWESLEWDQPNANSVLQSFVHLRV